MMRLSCIRTRSVLAHILGLATTIPLMGIQECNLGQDADGDGYTTAQGDCDDQCPTCYPGGFELCDGQDNNCDGSADEGLEQTWYLDEDSDGYGNSAQTAVSCAQPAGYAAQSGDCNETDASIHPNAVEVCDGIDSSCDGSADVGLEQTFYLDQDGDGYGSSTHTEVGCSPSQGFVPLSGDCDDTIASVHPFAPELCDAVDNNCNGILDQGPFFVDLDGDGFGRTDLPAACTPGSAVAPARGDCDDANPSVHPGAPDPMGDALDSDCGGTDKAEPHVGLSGTSFPTLRQALLAATPDTTLFVGPGTFPAQGLTLEGMAISLVSTHLAAATRLDGQGQGRILDAVNGEGPDTLIDGFTFTGGWDMLEGGAMLISDSSPTLRGCSFTHNTATGNAATGQEARGGALALTRSDSLLEALSFDANSVGSCQVTSTTASTHWDDGNDYASSETTTVVDTTTCFGGQGGALAIREGAPLLNGLQFTANTVEGEGGALFIQYAAATVSGATFQQNRAHSACTLTKTRVTTVEFRGYYYQENTYQDIQTQACTRVAEGGALSSRNAQLHLDDVQFTENQAVPSCVSLLTASRGYDSDGLTWGSSSTDPSCLETHGGAISVLSSTVSGTDVRLVDNAASSGGGISAQQGSLALADSHLAENEAVLVTLTAGTDDSFSSTRQSELFGGQGGAIRLSGGSATLRALSFQENTAGLDGGGIHSEGAVLTLASSTFHGETASSAPSSSGGNYDEGPSGGESEVVGGRGGALFVKGGQLALEHARITDSSALNGAGLYLAAPATLDHVLLTQGQARGSESTRESTYYGTRTDTHTPIGGRGAGLTLEGATASLSHVVVSANLSEDMTSISVTSPSSAPDIQTTSTDGGKGGGIYVVNGASSPAALTLSHCIISHNGGPGLEVASGTAAASYTLFYAQQGEQAHTLTSLGATNLEADPQFYLLDSFGLPVDFHLSTTSPALHAGNPSLHNVDGSQADLGLYGGSTGDGFDLDGDSLPDYFWPGAWSAAPAGFSSAAYDCDDQDALMTSCSP